jgi:tRNA (cytidine/uridine-2'-O-)-methyltransferase
MVSWGAADTPRVAGDCPRNSPLRPAAGGTRRGPPKHPPPVHEDPRLRAELRRPPFHVVLVEPEIPPNTGNIARLCAATRSPLHLVGKLGFRIDEHAVRRAGLDYWHLVDVRTHDSLSEALARIGDEQGRGVRRWVFTAHGAKSYHEVRFEPGDVLVFGKESVGLSPELLAEHADGALGIPTLGAVRSHNLANAVAIVLYEGLRQTGQLDGATLGP